MSATAEPWRGRYISGAASAVVREAHRRQRPARGVGIIGLVTPWLEVVGARPRGAPAGDDVEDRAEAAAGEARLHVLRESLVPDLWRIEEVRCTDGVVLQRQLPSNELCDGGAGALACDIHGTRLAADAAQLLQRQQDLWHQGLGRAQVGLVHAAFAATPEAALQLLQERPAAVEGEHHSERRGLLRDGQVQVHERGDRQQLRPIKEPARRLFLVYLAWLDVEAGRGTSGLEPRDERQATCTRQRTEDAGFAAACRKSRQGRECDRLRLRVLQPRGG
mmetsp:Transcript_74058/g.214542  ORF Transcript_74058/g.214542 Transcript_74058/m.214542 type:complete len:277 (-) Transcript_74058:1433-2263(-)